MKYLALFAVLFALGCPAISPEQAYPASGDRLTTRALNATVALVDEDQRTFCSGVLHGIYILTAYHCVDELGVDVQQIGFRSDHDGKAWKSTWGYRLLEGNEDLDIAVLAPTTASSPEGGARLSPEQAVYGDRVLVVGHPLGLLWTLTPGRVSHPKRFTWDMEWMQISAPVSPGNSGGPVYNVYGEIIGIVSFRLSSGFSPEPHLAGAVHLDVIRAILGRDG